MRLEQMLCEFKILKDDFIIYFFNGAHIIFFLTGDFKIGSLFLFI